MRPVAGTPMCSRWAQSLPSPDLKGKLNCNEKVRVPGEDRVQGEILEKSKSASLREGCQAIAASSSQQKLSCTFNGPLNFSEHSLVTCGSCGSGDLFLGFPGRSSSLYNCTAFS